MKNAYLALLSSLFAVQPMPSHAEPAPAANESPVAAHAEIHIDAAPQVVWNLIADVKHWPSWNPAINRVKSAGPIAAGVPFDWSSQGFTVTSTPVVVIFPSEISWTGKALGTRAWHRWEIIAEPQGGVRVRTEETFSGWLPRLLPGLMRGKLESTLPAWLRALKAAAEARH
jgi:hypothetical protein